MQKKERVRAALAGAAVDRPPAGFWGHDFRREWSAEGLAAAMLERFHAHDWDYMKVNPRATYYAQAWGCRYAPSGNASEGPVTQDYVLKSAADLASVQRISGTGGVFAEQLAALRLIGDGIGGADFIQTVFSPLSVVGRLAGPDGLGTVRGWMESEPVLLHDALAAVADTLAEYAAACLAAGASGIFFATTDWATRNNLPPELYARFGRPYDLRVLAAVQGAELNVLHVCRSHNILAELLDYPVHAFNWADREAGNPSLAEAQARTDKAVMGGVTQATIALGSPADVRVQVRDAVAATGGRRLLIAPGCSVSPQTPAANLQAAREAVAT